MDTNTSASIIKRGGKVQGQYNRVKEVNSSAVNFVVRTLLRLLVCTVFSQNNVFNSMIRPMNCESDVRELRRSHLAGSPLLGYAGTLMFRESKHILFQFAWKYNTNVGVPTIATVSETYMFKGNELLQPNQAIRAKPQQIYYYII